MNNARLTGISLLVGIALWLAGQAITVKLQTMASRPDSEPAPKKSAEPEKEKKLRFPRLPQR